MQGAEQPRKLIPLLFLCLAALAFGTAASVPTSQPAGPAGAFRIGTTGAKWPTDPALAYITFAWELEYATCAKLINYPDTPWDEHEASRLRPEIAAGMPTVSKDLRTYTFQIRNDYAFSPPASGVVTAQSMKYTFERALSPELASPGTSSSRTSSGKSRFTTARQTRSRASSPRATRSRST